MGKTKIILTSGGAGGLLGFLGSKLSSADLRALLERFLDGAFGFLEKQGAHASYTLIIAAVFCGMVIWGMKFVVRTKDNEIDRLVEQRDKFQKLFISEWKSSRQGKKR